MNDQHKSKEQLIEELCELRKQLQELNTAQQEDEFKGLVENCPDGIIRFNQSMEFLFANSLVIEALGIPPASYIGKTPLELNLQGNYYALWKSSVNKAFTAKEHSTFEGEFINHKWQHFYYQVRLVPELAKDGSVKSVLCIIRNISELKISELAFRASEKRNNRLLAALPDLLVYLSHDGVYLDYHATHPSLLYTPLEARIGKHVSQVLPLDQAEKIMVGIQHAITSGKIQIVEYQLTINNTLCYFEGRIINFDIDRVLVIVRNISELTRLKQEMARLDQLHLVGEMAASLGHEIRNPMTTVRGFLQLFVRKPEFTNYKEHLTLMIEELDRGNAIISEFLSLAKNKNIKLEEQNLNTIINSISPLIQSNATIANKSLQLDLREIPDLLIDAKEIRQLILNLVHNGLEAMLPDSTITIKTFMEDKKVVMAVQDTGSGIPPELIDKLGIPFFTTRENGTGLGLAICYHIAARHKATIEVSTSPNGTTFFVKFEHQ